MRELKEVAKEIKETVRKFTNEDGNWNRKFYSENRIYIFAILNSFKKKVAVLFRPLYGAGGI